MDHARHLAAVFRLDRDAVASVSLGDDGVLQVRSGRAVHHAGKGGMDPVVGRADGTAHAAEGRACVVAYLLLGKNAAADLLGEGSAGLQGGKEGIQGIRFRLPPVILPRVLLRLPGRLQESADVEKLRDI